jgi:N-acetylglutamate synthase-like GNAT family acetyltransferase
MRIRRAEPGDLDGVGKLLAEAELPALGPHPTLANLLLAEREGALVGAISMEVSGRAGLLRAVAVTPGDRRGGVARELFRSLTARAHELSLKDLYVVPGGAEAFFSALGFAEVAEDQVPLPLRKQAGEAPRWMRLALR